VKPLLRLCKTASFEKYPFLTKIGPALRRSFIFTRLAIRVVIACLTFSNLAPRRASSSRISNIQEKDMKVKFVILAFFLSISTIVISAQTSPFTYQGKLSDGSLAANGTYQFQFKLYDAPAGGNQIGPTLNDVPTTVTNGIFAVSLDFGVSSFDGNARFLEIGVRPNDSGQPYIQLNPRQQVMSTPYAVRSLNADQATTANNSLNLGGVPANQYVITNDPRMSDERNPLPGSSSYIQNGTGLQGTSNFNISGEGKASVFTAATQYNIGTKNVLKIPGTNNLFVGYNAGISNSSGSENVFVGTFAGLQNATSGANTFVGYNAGNANKANLNSFFGYSSGLKNTSGINNTFIGSNAGYDNLTASDNTFVGASAGGGNQTGEKNSYFGTAAGFVNTAGSFNSYFGYNAGRENQGGSNNSFFGYNSGSTALAGSNNSVFGSLAGKFVQSNNNAFFGFEAGGTTTFGNSNAFFGAGAGKSNKTANGNSYFGFEAGMTNVTGTENAFFGYQAGRATLNANNNSFFGYGAGALNISGKDNSFFGRSAGDSNIDGDDNSFFGANAGTSNTTGNSNAFFGRNAGSVNTTGGNNSFFGTTAGQAANASSNAFFGYAAGLLTTTGGANTFLGANTAFNNTTGASNTFIGSNTGFTNSTGSNNTLIGAGANVALNNLTFATAIGAGATVDENNRIVIGRSNGSDVVRVPGTMSVGGNFFAPDTWLGDTRVQGFLQFQSSGNGASTPICGSGNGSGAYTLSFCASSARYKTDVRDYQFGLNLIERLRPVSFRWKETDEEDLGFIAEEVAELEPRLAIRGAQGRVEGLKYANITTALVNAVKEQQAEIKDQQKENQKLREQIMHQQAQLDALRELVCATNSTAAVCRPK
jgi:hypothetical protein